MEKLSLEGTWKLRGEFLDVTAERFVQVMEREEGEFGVEFSDKGLKPFPYRRGFMEAQVPGDVTSALIKYKIIEEPLIKDNTKKSIWIKDLSWWFMRNFNVSKELLQNEEVRLFIEMLDYKADIIINGHIVAQHKNSFVPFYDDVKRYLKEGQNWITIRLTSGIEDQYERDSISFYCMSTEAICDQRIYQRKPQYTYGWDWCKPVPTCGIGRAIYLEGVTGAFITAFRADTIKLTKSSALLDLFFEIDNVRVYSADDGVLHYSIFDGEKEILSGTKELYLVGGLNFIHETVELDQVKLWWPNGYGEQHLYTTQASVICRNVNSEMKEKKIGVRTIEVNHDKRDDGTREYRFLVNGIKVWCKGGNWLPTDSIYLRTPKETYQTLVDEAKNAHFTMLRIWGGGTYEPDYFYDFCSENGILLMHDFMYACAFYPDHLDWFLHQATLEAEYQTKRLAHYPCMAIWTGNNEIHESYKEWFPERIAPERFYGAKIFNYIQPKAVKDNSPYTAYVPSSPFFSDIPNNMNAGDSHVWKWLGRAEETKMQFKYELEAFDRIQTRFSSEYGFYGAQMLSTVRRYHDGEEMRIGSEIWTHHGEQKRKREPVDGGIARHLRNTEELKLEEYLLYSGVLQGCLYEDLSNALRSKEYCSGNLIWMYNDCWPETGWTIIDYYLTRKVSFYYLKRAFAPKKFIVKHIDHRIEYTLINETAYAYDLKLEYGFMTFEGVKEGCKELCYCMAAHSYDKFSLEQMEMDSTKGFYYIKAKNDPDFDIATHVRPYFRDLDFPEANVKIIANKQVGEHQEVTVVADAYVPVAFLSCWDDRIKYSDNYFALIPNEEKVITVFDSLVIQEIKVLRVEAN